jgi:uncharacterized membrane protein
LEDIMKRLVWLSLALLLVASPAFSQYTFITVDYPGARHTRLVGLNDHLDIVGNYQLPNRTDRHAMLYSKGQFVPLDPGGLLGTNPSGATQINNRGDIVGWYQIGTDRHGFLLQAGVLTTIDYPGASWSQANGVTDNGIVIGEFTDSEGKYHGYILEGGSFRQVDYPGSVDSIPFYMNARGDIAGEWETDPRVLGHGFVLSKDGEWTSFDAPGAAENATLAIGINDHQQILGLFLRPDGQRRAFVLDGHDIGAGRYTTIEMPGTGAFPETMNNAGVFVGLYTDNGVVRGFIASPVPRR